MPRNRVAMHNIKEVMRLHHKLGHSQREIARSCGISLSTVNTVLQRARQVVLYFGLFCMTIFGLFQTQIW